MSKNGLGSMRAKLLELTMKRNLSHDTDLQIAQRIKKERTEVSSEASDLLAEKIINNINESATEEEILQKVNSL